MYNEKIDEIIHLLKNNSISDFIASLSLIVAIIAVIVTIIINVRENKKYINSLKPLLSFSLYEMNGLLLLLVKNNGQSEAKNIRIKVLELKNNGSNSKLMLDAIFNEAFMLYPTEETQGIIAISGRNVETDIFPQVKLDISFIEGNDNKKIEYCRTITFKRKTEEKDRLENIEDSIESISYSNNRMANYIEGRTLFTFDRMNVIPKSSLYKDMKDAFNNVEKEDNRRIPIMSKESMIKRDIQSDIDKIKGVLQSNSSIQELTNIHMYIDGKYQSKISNWGLSQYSWNDKLGFDYEFLGEDSLKHNLNNMKNKLEGYLQDYRLLPLASSASPAIKFINNNTNNNEIKVEIDFTNLINKINDMESLTETETNEAIEKVKEIEKIYKSKDSKKKKWEKIKNILIWLADKSVDLAIAYLPIITNSLN